MFEKNLTKAEAENYDRMLFKLFEPLVETAASLGSSGLDTRERGVSLIVLSMIAQRISNERKLIPFPEKKSFWASLRSIAPARLLSVFDACAHYNQIVKTLNSVRSKLNMEPLELCGNGDLTRGDTPKAAGLFAFFCG